MNFSKTAKLKSVLKKTIAIILIYVTLTAVNGESFIPVGHAFAEEGETTEVQYYRWKQYSKLSEVQDYLERVEAEDETLGQDFFDLGQMAEEGWDTKGIKIGLSVVGTILAAGIFAPLGIFLNFFGPGSKEFSDTTAPWSMVLITWDHKYVLSGEDWSGDDLVGKSASSLADYGVDLNKKTFDTPNDVGCWYIRKAGYDKDNGDAITVQIATNHLNPLLLVMDSYVVYEDYYMDNKADGHDYADDAPYLSQLNNGIQFNYNIKNRHDSYLKWSGSKVTESNDNGGNANSFIFYFCSPYTVSVYTLGYHIVEGTTTVWVDRECDCVVQIDGVLIVKGKVLNNGQFNIGPNGCLIIDSGGTLSGWTMWANGGYEDNGSSPGRYKDYKVTINGKDETRTKVWRQSIECQGMMIINDGAAFETTTLGGGYVRVGGNGALFVNGLMLTNELTLYDCATLSLGKNGRIGIGVKRNGKTLEEAIKLSGQSLANILSSKGGGGLAAFTTDKGKPTCVYPEGQKWGSFFYLNSHISMSQDANGFIAWPTYGSDGVHNIN